MTTEDALIEQMARAIYEATMIEGSHGYDSPEWERIKQDKLLLQEYLDEAKAALAIAKPAIEAEMRAEVERLQAALGQISRMCVYPDHTINLVTLNAAIHIAEAALEPKEPV